MENSLEHTGEEGRRHARSSSGHTLKNGEPFIQIDSISIDLPNVNSKNEKISNCEHFSIRKYVSDMRQKDSKACWPFESDTISGPAEIELIYPLPPLEVPKFRWWRCQNCLQGICNKKEHRKAVLVNNGESNSDRPSCTHVALTGSETMVFVSNLKQILQLDSSGEKGEDDADRLVPPTASESHTLVCTDQKAEIDGGSNVAIKVPEIDLENAVHPRHPQSTPTAAEVNDLSVSHGHEQGTDYAGHQLVSANDEVTGFVNPPKNLPLPSDGSHDRDGEMKAMMSSQISSVAVDGVNREPETLTVRQNGHPSGELDYASSDSAEVCPGYRSKDKPGSLHRRKVRKVRLLSDLLGQDGNLSRKDNAREESPLPATSDASEEFGAVKFLRRKLKRKCTPDDECKTIVSTKDVKEVEIAKGDAEEKQKAIVETAEDDSFAKTSPRSMVRSGWTAHGEDASSGLVKKKRKKKKNDEVEFRKHEATEAAVVSGTGDSTLMGPLNMPKRDLTKHDNGNLSIGTKKKKKNEPVQEPFNKKFGDFWGKVVDDFSLTSSGRDVLMGREPSSSFPPVLKTGSNSYLCNCPTKSKIPQEDNVPVARIPQSGTSKLREDSVGGVKFDLVQTCPTTVRLLPEGDGAVKKVSGLSSYGRTAEERYPLAFGYGRATTIPWQQVTPEEEGQVHRKSKVSTHLELNLPPKSRPDEFAMKGGHYKSTGSEHTTRFDHMGHFLMPHKEVSNATTGKGETSGSREKPTLAKNQNNKISSKAPSRGTSDEMEIVELMAKIQYENSLHDTVTDRTKLDIGKSPSYQNLRFGGEHKNGDLNLSLKEGSARDQTRPNNVKNLWNTKQKAVDVKYSPHMNTGYPIKAHAEQNQNQDPFRGHSVLYSQYQGKPSGSKRDDIMANNYKKTSGAFEGSSTYNMHHIAGPTGEPFRLWSSSAIPAARVPAQANIPRGSGLQTLGLKSPEQKATNKGILAETSSGENSYVPRPKAVKVRSPLGSSDFYSNEKIPALHLLSLMDARSGENVNGNPRQARQMSPVHQAYPSNELDFGAYKAAETLGRPSSDYRTINFLGRYDQRLGSSSSLVEPHENLRNGLTGQDLLKARDKGKQKCSDLAGSIGGSGSRQYVPSRGITIHNQQTDGYVEASKFAAFPPKYHNADKSEKEHLRSASCSVWPMRHSSEIGICTVNRNPAEFSAPEPGNAYTIGGSDLRFGKRVRAPDLSVASAIDLDRPKRGRKKKIVTTNHQQGEHNQVQ